MITVTEAVTRTIDGLPYGTFTASSFYAQVLHNLRLENNPTTPLQESVSRIFRMHRPDNIRLYKKGKSIWIKEENNING